VVKAVIDTTMPLYGAVVGPRTTLTPSVASPFAIHLGNQVVKSKARPEGKSHARAPFGRGATCAINGARL
jgi:hypothetical protein